MKVFLGGSKTAVMLPRELTELIDSYCQQKASFLIGDCFGADKLMQEYLHALGYPDVTVYVSGERVRHHSGTYPIRHIPAEGCKGYEFYRQKDIAMIEECDCAVMLWDGKTRGTRSNIEDLEHRGKSCRVILFDTSPVADVSDKPGFIIYTSTDVKHFRTMDDFFDWLDENTSIEGGIPLEEYLAELEQGELL